MSQQRCWLSSIYQEAEHSPAAIMWDCISSAMSTDLVDSFASFLILSSLCISDCCLLLFTFVAFIFAGLLLWRFWAFTLVPLLRPNEPKEMLYWIPFLGHTISFLDDADGLPLYERKHFKNPREPFMLKFAGKKLYIVTPPQDARAARENTATLSQHELTRDFIHEMSSMSAIRNGIQGTSYSADMLKTTLGPSPDPPTQLAESFHKRNLNPEQFISNPPDDFIRQIKKSMRWGGLSAKHTKSIDPGENEVSLLGGCEDVMIDSATRSYFDDALLQIEPKSAQVLSEIDDGESRTFLSKCSQERAESTSEAREKGIGALTAYFKLPRPQRAGGTKLVHNLEDGYRRLGLNEGDMASLMMMLYWAINANTYKLTFWLLSHLLRAPSLTSAIRAEISPALTYSSIDMTHLQQNCPHLTASLNEVLRLTSTPFTLHRILRPTSIGPFTLPPGSDSRILIPYRQLHLDEQIFGPDVHAFDPGRFLRNPDPSRSDGFGASVGMAVATGAVLAFVALAVGRCGLEVADGRGFGSGGKQPGDAGRREKVDEEMGLERERGRQGFPRLDEKRPCLGIMAPMAGDDLIVRVREGGAL